jgi:hypothetical protein
MYSKLFIEITRGLVTDDLPADILSVRHVICRQLAYSIASPTKEWN